ncbi:MAG: hypothetical protein AAGD06_12135, partial [Acidobacteriota bacterium]
MRSLKPDLPALAALLVAYGIFSSRGYRGPLAEVRSPVARITLEPGRHVDLDLDLLLLRPMPRAGACPTVSMHLHNAEGHG